MTEGWHHARGWLLSSLENFFAHGFLVDGKGEGAADLGIVKGFSADVGAEETDTDVGFLAKLVGVFFFGEGNEFGGDGVGKMELIVAVHPRFGVVVGNGDVADAIEFHDFGVPVVEITFDLEVVFGAPFLQFEGAVGDDVANLGPGGGEGGVDFAMLEDSVLGNGVPSVVFGEFGEEGDGATEFDSQGEVVHGLDPNFAEVLDFSRAVFFSVFDEVEHFGILRRPVGIGR